VFAKTNHYTDHFSLVILIFVIKSFHLVLAGFVGYRTGYTHIQLPEV